MIALYQNSDKTITYSLPGVPAGQTITKAILMVKRQESDTDASALVSINTTDHPSQASLTDNGSGGTGAASFTITKDNLDGIAPGMLFMCVKVVLANASAYEAPASREAAILRAGGIDDQD